MTKKPSKDRKFDRERAANIANHRNVGEINHLLGEMTRSYDPSISVALTADMQAIRTIIESHIQGRFSDSGRLIELLYGDMEISAALESRWSSVLDQCDNVLVTPSKSKSRYSNELASWFESHHSDIFHPRVYNAALSDSTMMGFGVCQIDWTDWEHPSISRWHPALTYYNRTEHNFRAITVNNGSEALNPDSNKWVVYSPYELDWCWTHGRVRSLAELWYAKRFALRDWNRYSEKYGNMITLLRLPSFMREDDKQKMLTGIENLGSGRTVPLPKGESPGTTADLELITAPTGTSDVFLKLLDYCNKSISTGILGQNATTDLKGGAYNAVETLYEGVMLGRARADIISLNRYFIRPVVRAISQIFYGTTEFAPEVKIDYSSLMRGMHNVANTEAEGA